MDNRRNFNDRGSLNSSRNYEDRDRMPRARFDSDYQSYDNRFMPQSEHTYYLADRNSNSDSDRGFSTSRDFGARDNSWDRFDNNYDRSFENSYERTNSERDWDRGSNRNEARGWQRHENSGWEANSQRPQRQSWEGQWDRNMSGRHQGSTGMNRNQNSYNSDWDPSSSQYSAFGREESRTGFGRSDFYGSSERPTRNSFRDNQYNDWGRDQSRSLGRFDYGSNFYGSSNADFRNSEGMTDNSYWSQRSGLGYGNGSRHASSSSGEGFFDQVKNSVKSFFGKGPKGYKRSDERIKEEVSEALYRHPRIDASEIELEVKDGSVTLMGTVESREIKRLVEDVAEDCMGVNNVTNQLRVGMSSSANTWETQSAGTMTGSGREGGNTTSAGTADKKSKSIQ